MLCRERRIDFTSNRLDGFNLPALGKVDVQIVFRNAALKRWFVIREAEEEKSASRLKDMS